MIHNNKSIAIVPKIPFPVQLEGVKKQNQNIQSVQKDAKRWTTTILDNIKYLMEKVKQVTVFIFKASASAFLYWVNPSLFAMGFVGGIAMDEKVEHAAGKVQTIWQQLSFFEAILGCGFCALSLPVTVGTATLLWSAYLGATLYQKSLVLDGALATFGDEMLQMRPAMPIG